MAYERVNWENLPSKKTPVNADNLNKLNDAIDTKVDSAISSIKIGGRNLIIGSANGSTDYAPGDGTLVDDGYLNNKAVSTNTAWSGYYIHMLDIANRNNLKNGDTVTISIYVSTTSENEVTHDIYVYRHDGVSDGGKDTMILKKGVWKRFKRTFSITDVTKLLNTMRFECDVDTSGYNILWSSPKIELGNKITDWTPAPEDMYNSIYPVGSIYMSVNSTNPANLFGGTWEQIKDRFLLACGSTYNAGSTGGEATHTLTVDEMPSHSHRFNVYTTEGAGEFRETQARGNSNTGEPDWRDASTQNTGGGQAHNNMPPYLAVYMWKRIS